MKEQAGGAGTREAKGPRDAKAAGSVRDGRATGSVRNSRATGSSRDRGAAGSARDGKAAGSARNGKAAGSARNGRAAGGSRDAAQQRREQMLRAALEVIVERGYAETRITDVAERTGTSPALVIYYFKTRDQLLTEAIKYSEDTWYGENLRRRQQIPTAAGRLAELVAATCLPSGEAEPLSYWLMWLDLWALSPRNPGVAAVRQKSDERWREAIRSTVLAGQEAGDFASVDVDDFTITLAAVLDGLTVQIALEDPQVPPQHAYDLAMRFAAGQLGFDWKPAPKRARQRR